jgi:hypothetical protein
MKSKFNMDEFSEELRDAHEESKGRKDGTGKFGTIFKEGEDIQRWRCKNGEHVIDVIPYRAGKFDPNRPEGKAAYFLDIYVHKNVGLTNDSFVCPSRNYKKRCPICEEIKRLADDDVPYEDYKDDVPKRVNVYNITCDDNDDEREKGVMVWDVANFFMEDKLRGLSKNKRTGEPIYYASPKMETGRSISFERRGKGQGNVEFVSHEFLKREYDISKDLLEQAYCLDEIIHIPSYEELLEAFQPEEHPKKKEERGSRKHRSSEDEDEQDSKKESRSKRKRDSEDEDDQEDRSRKRKRDSEDDKQEEQPKKRKSKNEDEQECPAKGGTFGEDCDTLAKCKKCEIWDDCAKAHDEIESKSSKNKNDDDDDDTPKRKRK